MTTTTRRPYYGRGTIDLILDDGDLFAPSRGWRVTAADGTVTDVSRDGPDSYDRALAVLGLKRPRQASPVLAELYAGGSWDDGDPWGSGMMWLGAACDLLAIIGEGHLIPESAGYRPGGLPSLDEVYWQADHWTEDGGADVDSNLADLGSAYRVGRITPDDLALAARILDRYLDMVRAAGRDY